MLNILGIDIGSVAVSIVILNRDKKVIKTAYRLHHGAINDTLLNMLSTFDLKDIGGIAATTSTPEIIKDAVNYNNQLAIITAVKQYHPDARNVLIVGGENFGLISFNESGEYKSYKTNATCAAGTGSFLDQQMLRLKLESIEKLAEIAFENNDTIPPIASRCAVFAKTDLIHAQQEGYSLGQICDSLCEGLVKNITDTLFGEDPPREPLVFIGGVSKNKAVIKHLKKQLKIEPVVSEFSCFYGAIGAALIYLNEKDLIPLNITSAQSLIIHKKKKLEYGYEPLDLKISDYPDFKSFEKFDYVPLKNKKIRIEVDIYEPLVSIKNVYMGIDIGSTSTKAVLIDEKNRVLAGFYTMTAGQPLIAAQAIFEAINKIEEKHNIKFEFKGVATTGAGRKFVGKIIGADLYIDEITAHARAASRLDPEVDTIIEIGGQDSKFTTLKNGMVNFCVMNNVCAAGTGSFIEEQANKLGCSLNEYSDRALKKKSPITSDRCTVFMERDINHYLSESYPVDEILASVLHSVRDNYLSKVTKEANIGKKIFFQGATAKNKALVAAFENKLNKPIHVSKYCHLTGALGCAIMLVENNNIHTKFRGLSLYKENIPVESEICKLCHNNCKIKKVTIQNEIVAFGFLCGRDYNSAKIPDSKKMKFNLIREYQHAFKTDEKIKKFKSDKIVGIPYGLYLAEEHELWTYFFNQLGIKTISSKGYKDASKIGKKISKAEFCTPISTYYGHVKYLSQKADYLFLPVYFESREKEKDVFRHYCYYTQFATSLVTSSKSINIENKCIMPVIDTADILTKIELCKTLTPFFDLDYWSIVTAYDKALDFYNDSKLKIKSIYDRETANLNDLNVMILGRPYVVLDNHINKGIIDIFANLNIKVFYHDMLSFTRDDVIEIEPLLKAFHWNYTAKILASALIIAKTKGLYPVYMSSFKCSPDSFALEYFKRIMNEYHKPYIILDLDEHGSNIGYETRIEAVVQAFRNHFNEEKKEFHLENYLSVNPDTDHKIEGKTLLFPSWDDSAVKLIEAVLIKEGINARMVPVTEHAIQQGLKTNNGQCLPVNIIYQSFIDYITENNLYPSNIAVWTLNSRLACNIRLYPYFIKSMFESYGKGMEKISVYTGSITLFDLSAKAGIDSYLAYMFSGMLRKIGCKIRPYEEIKGITDFTIKQSELIFYNAFLGKIPLEKAVMDIVAKFKNIKVNKINRPKIAILGDLYVRDNEIMNQNLIKCIEEAGGEVIAFPLSDFGKLISNSYLRRWIKSGYFKDAITTKGVLMMVNSIEDTYYKHFNEILQESASELSVDMKFIMDNFHVMLEHAGESMDNLISIFYLLNQNPDISLFVQAIPAFCCAGLVTEAMSSKIESVTGVPVVSLIYDGTEKNQNDKIIPYIKYPRKSNIEFLFR